MQSTGTHLDAGVVLDAAAGDDVGHAGQATYPGKSRAHFDRSSARRQAAGSRRWAASGDASQKASSLSRRRVEPARHRPHLDGLVALVAVRARRPRRDAHDRPAGDPLHLVAEAHRQRAARDHVDLLHLVVEVPGALLEVGVGRDADQRDRQLLSVQGLRQPPELARDVRVRVVVGHVVRVDDRVVARCHAAHCRARRPGGGGQSSSWRPCRPWPRAAARASSNQSSTRR